MKQLSAPWESVLIRAPSMRGGGGMFSPQINQKRREMRLRWVLAAWGRVERVTVEAGGGSPPPTPLPPGGGPSIGGGWARTTGPYSPCWVSGVHPGADHPTHTHTPPLSLPLYTHCWCVCVCVCVCVGGVSSSWKHVLVEEGGGETGMCSLTRGRNSGVVSYDLFRGLGRGKGFHSRPGRPSTRGARGQLAADAIYNRDHRLCRPSGPASKPLVSGSSMAISDSVWRSMFYERGEKTGARATFGSPRDMNPVLLGWTRPPSADFNERLRSPFNVFLVCRIVEEMKNR